MSEPLASPSPTRAARTATAGPDRQMLAWLDDQAGGEGGWTVSLIETRKFASNRLRQVFRADHAGSGRTVAIKTNSSVRGNRAEFRALQAMHDRMPGTVAPLHITPNGRAFALEWIDAPLLKLRVEQGDRPGALRLAGAWLADFQNRTAGAKPTGRLIGLPRLPLWSGWGDVRVATARLRARLRGLAGHSGLPVMLHGDYQAGNLFDQGDRVVVFDRVADIWGPAHLDSAKFLSVIAARRVRADERNSGWSGEPDADRRSFFEGYCPLAEAELDTFDLVEDMLVYRKWRHYRGLGENRLDDEMRRRGLLGDPPSATRPGRFVAGVDGTARWSDRPGRATRAALG